MNLAELYRAIKIFKLIELGESEQLCANITKGTIYTKDQTVQSMPEA